MFKMSSKTLLLLIVMLGASVLAGFLYTHFRKRADDGPNLRAITLQLNWLPDGGHAFLFYGLDNGIFREHGFDVTIQNGRGSGLSARLLAAGKVDVALMGADSLVSAIERGADIKSIGVIYDKSPVVIYSKASQGIRTLEDLYGKRLGLTPAADSLLQYEGVMKLNNFDRSKITEVSVDAAAAPNLLLDDKLDALLEYSYHSPVNARLKGFEINEVPLRAYGDDMYGMTIAVRPQTFTKQEIENLKDAIQESFWGAIKNPDEAVTELEKRISPETYEIQGQQATELEKQAFSAVRLLSCGSLEDLSCKKFFSNDKAGWERTVHTLRTFGIIDHDVPTDTIIED